MLRSGANKRHHGNRIVAPLLLEAGEIDGFGINARRGTGFQAIDPKGHFPQPTRQGDGGRITGASARVVFQANVNQPAEEGASGQHH